ncbi:hypothetical protein Dip510_000118 [Elusimicrobium posterum]|uniref:hypothetical protein n=1 Tax=Elusimicrobium posterum TaxID=3116653 RepID=UPI003C796E52
MKKFISLSAAFCLLFNLFAPCALQAKTVLQADAVAKELSQQITANLSEVRSAVIDDGKNVTAEKTFNSRRGHSMNKTSGQILLQIEKTRSVLAWTEVDAAFQKIHPTNSIEYRIFKELTPAKTYAYKTPANVTAAFFQPELIVEIASEKGYYLSRSFISQSIEFSYSGDWKASEMTIKLGETSEKLLKSKSFPEIIKRIYPQTKGVQLETLTRLTTAYLEEAVARAEVAKSVAKYNDAIAEKRPMDKNAVKERRVVLNNAKKYSQANKALKEIYRQPQTQRAIFDAIKRKPTTANTKYFLRNLGSTLGSVLVIGTLTVVGLMFSQAASASNDAELKAQLNDLTSETIKNNSAIAKAVKDMPEVLPVLSAKQQSEYLKRTDILDNETKLYVSMNYAIFANYALNNPAETKKLLADMEARDKEMAASEPVSFNETFTPADAKKSQYNFDAAPLQAYLN